MSTLRQNLAHEPAQLSMWTGGKYERDYLEHRAAHPEVFERLVRLARKARDRGWKKIGMRTLWEVERWRRGVAKPKDSTNFHLNDHLAPYYSRAIMRECPDLNGMFEVRER